MGTVEAKLNSVAAPSNPDFWGRLGTNSAPARGNRMTFKVCTKCAAELTIADWLALKNLGTMDDGDGGLLEVREHSCTGSLVMAPSDVAAAAAQRAA